MPHTATPPDSRALCGIQPTHTHSRNLRIGRAPQWRVPRARFYLVDKAGLPTGVETRLELTVEEERQKRLHTDYADDERRRTRNRTDLASRGQGLRRTGDARR